MASLCSRPFSAVSWLRVERQDVSTPYRPPPSGETRNTAAHGPVDWFRYDKTLAVDTTNRPQGLLCQPPLHDAEEG